MTDAEVFERAYQETLEVTTTRKRPLFCLAHGTPYAVGAYCPHCRLDHLIALWPGVPLSG